MDKFLEKLYDRAAKANRKIALAEGTDHRVVKAAEILTKKRIARVVLIGDGEVIKSKFPDIDFSGIEIVNPATSEKADELKDSRAHLEELFYQWLMEPLTPGEREELARLLAALEPRCMEERRNGFPNVKRLLAQKQRDGGEPA